MILLPSTALATKDEDRIRRGINQYRLSHDRRALRPNYKLDRVAQMRSDSMMRRGYFGHVSPAGIDAKDLMRKVGIRCRYWGEIIAWSVGYFSITHVLTWWKMSWPHKTIMLNKRWRKIGVGIASADGRTYYTAVFCRR